MFHLVGRGLFGDDYKSPATRGAILRFIVLWRLACLPDHMKQVSDRYEVRDQWCRHLPKLHGVLANASLPSEFPAASHTSDLFDACAFWETLHYLLKHLLGWENPGLGLVWWYAHGQPIHDSKLLSLVSEIWGRDQVLDLYAAWAWRTTDTTTDVRPDDSACPNEEWWNSFRGRPESSWYNPFYGGYNLLHLGHSDLFLDSERVIGPWELYMPAARRRSCNSGRSYVRGLLSDVQRKNAEAIALDQNVAPRTPQRFLENLV